MILGETQMWRQLYEETREQRDKARESAARWEQEAAHWWEQAMRPAHLRDGDESR